MLSEEGSVTSKAHIRLSNNYESSDLREAVAFEGTVVYFDC